MMKENSEIEDEWDILGEETEEDEWATDEREPTDDEIEAASDDDEENSFMGGTGFGDDPDSILLAGDDDWSWKP